MSKTCWCSTCRPVVFGDMRMVLCPECGNKRCPRATDHRNACSGSNELGQAGSAYTAHLAPQRIINGAIMTQEEIEAIAQRPTCCKPFGEAVTISRAERDALVAMARDGMRYRFIRDVPWYDSPLRDVITMQKNAIWDQAIDSAMAKEKE